MDYFSLPISSRPSGKAASEKVDKRFSQLYTLPPKTSLLTAPEQELQPSPSKRQSPKQNLKHFFRRLLPSNTSNQKITALPQPASSEEQLWLDLLGTSSSVPIVIKSPHTPSANSDLHTASYHFPSRQSTALRKERPRSAVVIRPPTNAAYPSFKPSSIFTNPKSKGTNIPIIKRRPDSKFSSISSLPSLIHPSNPHSTTTIHLTPQDFQSLEKVMRRLRRRLRHQEYLASHLSNNIISIFSRKEKQLCGSWRVRTQGNKGLISELFRAKEDTGRAFLRKAVFLQRSAEICTQLEAIVVKGRGRGDVEGEVVDLLATLKEDLKTQRGLDDGLRKGVLRKCEEGNWKGSGSGNEEIMVRRFVMFVECRLGLLERCYGKIDGLVEGMVVLVGGERN